MHSNELIREVEEELQREKLLGYWRRYGTAVTTLAVLVVAGTAGWIGWQAWTARHHAAESAGFTSAQAVVASAGPTEGARALDGFAAGADPGYAAIARLTAATVAGRAGDATLAKASLAALADDPKAEPLLRDLARVLGLGHVIDSEDPRLLIEQLTPLAAAGAPWRHYGRQLLASAQLRAGDRAAAISTLKTLTDDPDAPESLKTTVFEIEQALQAGGAAS